MQREREKKGWQQRESRQADRKTGGSEQQRCIDS
jgi:hypothetical protein